MRSLLAVGILLALAGMAGLWHYAGALPGTFAALTAPAGQALPLAAVAAETQLPRVQLSALLYGAGAALICAALRSFGRERTLTPGGKLAVALGGAAAVAGAAMAFTAWWQVRQDFLAIAAAEAAPRPDELAAAIAGWQRELPRGFGLATAGLLAMLAAALPSLQRGCAPLARPGRELALPLVALLAIGGFALSWLLAGQAGRAVFEAMAVPNQPRPAELAAHLDTVIRYGLIGAICLATVAATQGLAALALPPATQRADG